MKTKDSTRRKPVCSIEPLEPRQLFSNFYITNTNDSGTGSLRQAIYNVNSDPGAGESIVFNIAPVTQSHNIALNSLLPTVTHSNVTIDGHSESRNQSHPILLTGSGLTFSGADENIAGLWIKAGTGQDILLENGGGDSVQGCTLVVPNSGGGIEVNNSSFNTLGESQSGGVASQANIITGTGGGDGVFILGNSDYNGVTGDTISDCYYGIDLASATQTTQVFGNSVTNNSVGLVDAGYDGQITSNNFSGNSGDGVYETGVDNYVTHSNMENNRLNGIEIAGASGFDQFGYNMISGNTGDGVLFRTSAVSSQSYGATSIYNNVISLNRQNGILLANTKGSELIGQNIIDANTLAGIARQSASETQTSVANLTSLALSGGSITISFSVHGLANDQCHLEFFISNLNTTTDGLTYIGEKDTTFDSHGNVTGTATFATSLTSGVVTATVTNYAGTGVFSNPLSFQPFRLPPPPPPSVWNTLGR